MKLGLITCGLFLSLFAAITYRFYKETMKIRNYERWDRGE